MHSSGPAQGPVVGTFEQRSEFSGLLEGEKILGRLSFYLCPTLRVVGLVRQFMNKWRDTFVSFCYKEIMRKWKKSYY
jgi:hypothetical protein